MKTYCLVWDAYYDPDTRVWLEPRCGCSSEDECPFKCWKRPSDHPQNCACSTVSA